MNVDSNGKRSRNPDVTTQKLRDATRAQLIQGGYSALSIQRILKQAGVSKGALFHHFSTKDHLVAAAFEDVLNELLSSLRVVGAELQRGKVTKREFLKRVTNLLEDDLYMGIMEVSLGIRTELALGDLLESTIENWRVALAGFWVETFDLPGHSKEQALQHWAVAANALRGHAFSFSFGGSDEARQRHYDGFMHFFLDGAEVRELNKNQLNIIDMPRGRTS